LSCAPSFDQLGYLLRAPPSCKVFSITLSFEGLENRSDVNEISVGLLLEHQNLLAQADRETQE